MDALIWKGLGLYSIFWHGCTKCEKDWDFIAFFWNGCTLACINLLGLSSLKKPRLICWVFDVLLTFFALATTYSFLMISELRWAGLSWAQLSSAQLGSAQLSSAQLSSAQLSSAFLWESHVFIVTKRSLRYGRYGHANTSLTNLLPNLLIFQECRF